MPPRLTTRWRRAAGFRLHSREAGDAGGPLPPVVCVHGWGVSSRYMARLVGQLAGHTLALAPDLPGHGPSERAARALGVVALAEVLLAWMDGAGIERPLLVGNSLGCQVVIELAARHPDRAAALALVGPTADAAARSALAQAPRFARTAFHEGLALFPILAVDYAAMGPRRLAQESRVALEHEPELAAAAVRAPSLVIRGVHDHIAAQPWCERLAGILGAPLLVVPGHGHAVHFSAPVVVGDAVLALAARAAAAEPVR